MDRAALERDLNVLNDLVGSAAFEALTRDQPVELRPGLTIVDMHRFAEALRVDLLAGLAACDAASRIPVVEATAWMAHGLLESLRDLMDRRDSEEAGWETLAELSAAPRSLSPG